MKINEVEKEDFLYSLGATIQGYAQEESTEDTTEDYLEGLKDGCIAVGRILRNKGIITPVELQWLISLT